MRTIPFILFFLLAISMIACNPSANKNQIGLLQSSKALASASTDSQAMDPNSVYQLKAVFTNQEDQEINLPSLSGHYQVMAMIFTSCGFACPRIVDIMKNIQLQLPENIRQQTRFTLISFDSEIDTAERLKQYSVGMHLDKDWTLLNGDEAAVRQMSMLLDVQYSQLPDGGFNHANVITILDKKGRIIKRLEGLDIEPAEAVKSLEAAAKK